MKSIQLADGYKSVLTLRETQRAIKFVKDTFQAQFVKALNLERITAPLIVMKETGLNDDLSGVERKVEFDIKNIEGTAEIVQSLAKWKRTALKKYQFNVGEGIYTDMNAVRRDDDVDNIHSILVDQWDWERVISRDQRTEDYLKTTVRNIVNAVVATEEEVKQKFPQIKRTLSADVKFISSQELEDMYPTLSPKEREMEITREYKTVFITQIGETLRSGIKHDSRAPDYDDWKLNGDLLFWNETLNAPLEISSMGIRVDADALRYQLDRANAHSKLKFAYHQDILHDKLPLTIGGGIGQSRLCLLILEKLHIGEVQSAIWPKEMLDLCKKEGINIL